VGKVFATLYQRPLTQGRLAFEAVHRFIVEEIRPKPVQKLPPYIVLRSNLDVFIENSPEFDNRAASEGIPSGDNRAASEGIPSGDNRAASEGIPGGDGLDRSLAGQKPPAAKKD
jgi:hypothetical protein